MNYGDALDYLLFQHDEYTMKPILDEQGRKQLRDLQCVVSSVHNISDQFLNL